MREVWIPRAVPEADMSRAESEIQGMRDVSGLTFSGYRRYGVSRVPAQALVIADSKRSPAFSCSTKEPAVRVTSSLVIP